MKWTKTGSISRSGEKKIRIKTQHKKTGLNNLETQQIGHAVGVSRQILPQVIALVSWPTPSHRARVHRLMDLYFQTGATPSQQDVRTILKRLELVMNGINSRINVKVAPDDDAYGYVGVKGGVSGVLRGVFSRRHNLVKISGKKLSAGDIHIDSDTLDDAELSIITFIHEATHKYAGTDDYDDRGYLENNGLQFQEPGLTKAEALNNADSYAWFCYAAYYR